MSPSPRRLRQRPARRPAALRVGARRLGALGAAAAALLTAPLAAPAGASAATYTVSVGGDASPGTHPLSADGTEVVRFSTLNDAGTVVHHNCTSADGTGAVTSGPAVDTIATLDTTWTGCAWPGFGLSVAASTWSLDLDGPASAGTDVIAGRVTGVELALRTTANPQVCRFTVEGSARVTYDEGTAALRLEETGYTGALRVSQVTGCLGRIQQGNEVDMATELVLTSPDGTIALS